MMKLRKIQTVFFVTIAAVSLFCASGFLNAQETTLSGSTKNVILVHGA